ncbi:hypothetical protein [Legionella quateirensis]|uniref:Uncharacterized protein n=1 Tax=Legionella quateirensis TaxID=45072 RepID=A0A378KUY4_9GAMM|nr:hypothetical protein [Legionella quateirensis]KTD47611.1 hypothetical protein Lqua_2004 [Legionella quateirensis]STY18634.1 Uncharacterised protein [Legionella quateirensis]
MNNLEKDSTTNILFVSQRLSDFVEMRRAAVGLKKYGYRCIMLFCGVGSQVHDNIVIQEIDNSISAGEFDNKIIYNEVSINFNTLAQKIVRFFNFNRVELEPKALPEIPTELINELNTEIQEKQPESEPLRWYKKLKIVQFFHRNYQRNYRIVKYKFRSLKSAYRIANHYKAKIKIKTKAWIIRSVSFLNQLFFSPYYVIPLSYKVNYKRFCELLTKHQINLIILPEDIVGKITPVLIKAGHNNKIPSMVLPYTICNQSEAFQALKERDELSINSKLINKVLGILFKSWVMKDEQHAVLRLPAPHVLGHLFIRSSPPDPWMMNSGYANVIAIENEQMFQYYRKSGIPASKMKITGACYDDNLAGYYLDKENQRAKLYKQLDIHSDKPLFLIGGFPNQIVGNPPGFDFKDAEDAVNFITECVDRFKNDYELVFRPHPNYLELSKLFAKKNILVTDIDTARLVAVSDVYLAFASATIRWAISCGVPTINYDMFYYDFSDYKHVNGVLNACTQDEFKTAIQRMSDPDEYLNLKNHLEVEKMQWGNLDGQSIHRINGLVKELVQLKKVRRKAS